MSTTTTKRKRATKPKRAPSAPRAPMTVEGEYVRLDAAATELQMFNGKGRPDTLRLLKMSRKGAFAPVMVVTRKHVLVKRADLEEWKRKQTLTQKPAEDRDDG